MRNSLIKPKNEWDKRHNLKNKPSIAMRTVEIIDYLMRNEELPAGKAMEKLMVTPNLYQEIEEKLREEGFDIPIEPLKI